MIYVKYSITSLICGKCKAKPKTELENITVMVPKARDGVRGWERWCSGYILTTRRQIIPRALIKSTGITYNKSILQTVNLPKDDILICSHC